MASTYDININVDSDNAVKGLTDLENETKVASNSVQGLQNELDELNNKAKGLDVSSREFKKLSGEIKKVDGDLKNAQGSLAGLSSADKAGELGKLAGGLGAVATAGALIGAENETAEEMFKIMGTGIAITAGVQGAIEGFSSATKLATGFQMAFNVAVMANPIGVLVIAILAVISAIALLVFAFSDSVDATQEQIDTNKKLIDTMDDQIDKQKELIGLSKLLSEANGVRANTALANAKLRGASEEELFNIKKDFADKGRVIELAELKLKQQLQIDENIAHIEKLKQAQRINAQKRSDGDISKEEFFAEQKRIKDTNESRKLSFRLQKELIDLRITDSIANDLLADKEVYVAEKVKSVKAVITKKEKKELKQRIVDNTATLLAIEKIENEYLDSKISKEDLERNKISDKYFLAIEDAKRLNLDLFTLEEAQKQELADLDKRFEKEREENEEKASIKRIEKETKEAEIKEKIHQDVTSSINDLAGLVFGVADKFGKQDEKSKDKRAKKQFQVNKALQLSSAVIDTAKAITSSLVVAPLATPQGIPSLVATALAGATSIAKIASTQYKSSNTGAVSIPSIGGGGGGSVSNVDTSAPTTNFIGQGGETGGGAVNNAGSNQSPIIIQNNIVESDITDAQSNVANIVEFASFGLPG